MFWIVFGAGTKHEYLSHIEHFQYSFLAIPQGCYKSLKRSMDHQNSPVAQDQLRLLYVSFFLFPQPGLPWGSCNQEER